MLNLPNLLALFRIALAPLMFWLLVDRSNPIFDGIHLSWLNYAAAFVFVVASVTDFFDGFIARSWNQITKLGGILDPLADKMLMLAAFLGLVFIGQANPWAIFIILSREFFITGLRVQAASEGKSVNSTMAGKVKTVAQMIAVGFLMMNWPYADALLWISVGFTLYSGWEYIRGYMES
jgi:CDP-diacylglycerol--glycerol-3-phosphate 3-phosphatidyltransferase